MNADNILFHPHYAGDLMTNDRSGKGMGETCKKRLVKVFVEEKYGREDKLENKYIKKGLQTEEDAITLYSRVNKTIYFKNTETISNDYLIGTPDLSDHKNDIRKAKTIIDLKSCWDLFTFWNARTGAINKDYYWQIQSYLALTGAEKGILAYCLINTPDVLIYDEKKRLQYKMGVISDSDPNYIEACAAIDHNMTFDDIPLNERMFEIQINRDDNAIQLLYERIKKCREYMNNHLFIREPEEIDLAA